MRDKIRKTMPATAFNWCLVLLSYYIMMYIIGFCSPVNALSLSVTSSDGHRFVSELSDLRLRCNVSDAPDYVYWYYYEVPQGTDRAHLARCHWQSGQCKLEPGSKWTNVAASRGTLNITGVARSQDGYYECEAFSGSHGAKEGIRIVVVAAGSPPTVTLTPETLRSGDRVTLTCNSSGWNPPARLSWLKVPLNGSQPVAVNQTETSAPAYSPPAEKFGIGSSAVSVTVDSADDEAIIVCTATHAETNTSQTARQKLRVQHQPTVDIIANIAAIEGVAISIACKAKGYPAPLMQLTGANGSVLQESPTGIFTLSPVDRSHAGTLTCVATNLLGSASSAFRLSVLLPPSVRTPSSVEANEGNPVLLPCQVLGNPAPVEVIWRHPATGAVMSPENDIQTANLRLARAEPRLSGEWRCEARAILTPATGPPAEYRASAAVFLTVKYRPGPPAVSQPRDLLTSGGSVNITCLPNSQTPGQPPPRLRWSRAGELEGWRSPGPSLLLDPVGLSDSGVYVCIAGNELGESQSAHVSLQVVQEPRLTQPPQRPMEARAGDKNFALICQVSAYPKPRLRWFRDGVPVMPGLYTEKTLVSSSDPFAYEISLYFRSSQRSSIGLNDTGRFQCLAANDLGNATVEFQLQVITKPIILNSFSKTALVSGLPFICEFISQPGYRVTWLTPGGVWLPSNATASGEPWHLFSPAPTGPLGNYTCRVENSIAAAERRLELVAASAPDPPVRVATTAVAWDSFRLAWTPGFDGGYPARVRIRAIGWNSSAGARATTWLLADAKAVEVTLGGLYPDTAYTVTCTAENHLGESLASAPLTVVTRNLRLPQVTEARWDPAAGRLAFRGVPGLCARVEASADGGATWALPESATLCLPFQAEGASVAAAAASLLRASRGPAAASLYRVSLCLSNRTDVCGAPFTAYPLAISGNVSVSTIIVVACLCAVVIISLITVLIWLCVRRRGAAARAKAVSMAQQQDLQSHTGKGSYKSGQRSGKGTSGNSHTNGGLHHHPAVAFVSPTTAAAGQRTSETCFDACDGRLDCSSTAASPQLGTMHVFPRAFYESDATDNSESPPTPNKQHRKVIYEVVV